MIFIWYINIDIFILTRNSSCIFFLKIIGFPMHHLVATFDDAAATVISRGVLDGKRSCVPQALMMAAGFSPAQRANTESRTMLALAYPPRFAAPVRPGVGAATGRMQPGWPVNTPTPQHCGAARRSSFFV